MSKVGPFSLDYAIAVMVYDMKGATDRELRKLFAPLEVTDNEFTKAIHTCLDWGIINYSRVEVDDGGEDWRYEANHIPGAEEYAPKILEVINGPSEPVTYTFKITTKKIHHDRLLDMIVALPVAELVEEI